MKEIGNGKERRERERAYEEWERRAMGRREKEGGDKKNENRAPSERTRLGGERIGGKNLVEWES